MTTVGLSKVWLRPFRAGAGVVADEEDEAGAFEALHHGERFALADDHLGPRVEVLEEDVPHAVVGLVDQELSGAGLRRAFDGRVHVGGQEPLEALVLRTARITS